MSICSERTVKEFHASAGRRVRMEAVCPAGAQLNASALPPEAAFRSPFGTLQALSNPLAAVGPERSAGQGKLAPGLQQGRAPAGQDDGRHFGGPVPGPARQARADA